MHLSYFMPRDFKLLWYDIIAQIAVFSLNFNFIYQKLLTYFHF